MKIQNKQLENMRIFMQYLLGEKGGFEQKDGTFALYNRIYMRLKNFQYAKSVDDLTEENKKVLKKQVENLIEEINEIQNRK